VDNAEYNEWVPAGALVKGLFAMISLLIVLVTFVVLLFSEEPFAEEIIGLGFSWGILAFLLFVFWNFRGLRIRINSAILSVDYGLFNKKSFLLKEIISCKKTKAFGRYYGIGVRYGIDGSIAYTTSFANAVEIAPTQGRVFVFSSKNADKVCETINQRKPT